LGESALGESVCATAALASKNNPTASALKMRRAIGDSFLAIVRTPKF
jgi:hypothetical protein